MVFEIAVVLMAAYLINRYHLGSDAEWKKRIGPLLFIILIFTIFGICSTHFMAIKVSNGALITGRDFIITSAAFIGGPFVGIPTGIIVGIERYTLGGITALPCCISAILAGLIGGVLHRLSGDKFPPVLIATAFMLIMEIVHVLMIPVLSDGYFLEDAIYMVVGSALAMLVASYLYHRYIDKENNGGKVPWI